MVGSSSEGESSKGNRSQPRRRHANGRAVGARLVAVLGVLGLAAGAVWGLKQAAALEPSPTTLEIPALSVQAANVEPGSVTPVNASLKGAPKQRKQRPNGGANTQGSGDSLVGWAQRVGPAIGVPVRALLAYGRAEISLRQTNPACRLSWATLAGIGRVESDHGRYGGAVLQANGLPSKPIIGVPLDGSRGFKSITDTDDGRFDGDSRVDRAVGPMQFIPSTWASHAADGNGDGVANPQQIDDAALAAAHYLCAGGRDMSSAEGWWAGLWSYNQSVEYGQQVFGLADHYARAVNSRS
ncbi:MAG: murein transglycosylase [Actinophytocola sp.]|nr:murein transglycosylase [Actinophytocola sp.]